MTIQQLQSNLKEAALQNGISEHVLADIQERCKNRQAEGIGVEALLLVGEEGVPAIKKIEKEKNLTKEQAILDFLKSDPDKLKQFKQTLDQLAAEVEEYYFHELLLNVVPEKRQAFAQKLESLLQVPQ